MQSLEVSDAARPLYGSLGFKGLMPLLRSRDCLATKKPRTHRTTTQTEIGLSHFFYKSLFRKFKPTRQKQSHTCANHSELTEYNQK